MGFLKRLLLVTGSHTRDFSVKTLVTRSQPERTGRNISLFAQSPRTLIQPHAADFPASLKPIIKHFLLRKQWKAGAEAAMWGHLSIPSFPSILHMAISDFCSKASFHLIVCQSWG